MFPFQFYVAFHHCLTDALRCLFFKPIAVITMEHLSHYLDMRRAKAHLSPVSALFLWPLQPLSMLKVRLPIAELLVMRAGVGLVSLWWQFLF